MSDDLREALSAAMDGGEAASAPVEGAAPAAPAPVEPAAQPAAEPQAQAPASDGPARAANGQFAPKAEQAQAAPNAESAPQAGAAAPAAQAPDLSRPPASLSAPVKAMWATLSPEVQADFHRRERETDAGFRERGEELNRIKPVLQALDPIKAELEIAGTPPAVFVSQMVGAHRVLGSPNKAEAQAGILHLCRAYGIPLPASQPQGQGQSQLGSAPQGQPAPEFQAMAQRVQGLEAQLGQQQAQADAAREAEVSRNLTAFFNDPKNTYGHNVAGQMVQLLKGGLAHGSSPQERLQNAYEQACWLDPTVRSLMQAGSQAQQAQAAHAQRARGAAVSVTGAPTVGGSPTGGSPPQSIRAGLEAAWDA